jgi:protein-tyrosine-phosphatase
VPDPYFGGPDGFVVAIDLIEKRIGELVRELTKSG